MSATPRLRVTVIDLVTRGPTKRIFSRLMNPNYASIMPQAVAVWCEELGHRVKFVCYTGTEDVTGSLVDDTDVLFLGAFTRSAFTAYAISNIYRKRGVITVLGGPHARSYPEDSAKYFDYVLGLTGKTQIDEILRDRLPSPAKATILSADRQPPSLPGARERWKFIEATIAKAPTIKFVPMIASMGCPYTCDFCIDATISHQPLDLDQIRDELDFLLSRIQRPIVAWHDPNFGVRFDEIMTAIESAVPSGRMRFVAESSLSLLTEVNVKRLKRNGFVGILPGIESWFDYGNKSKSTRVQGADKLKQVSNHVNMVLSHIPYVQTNFVLGLDCDEGIEPFELTKKFIDLTPGAFPAFSLLTSYGRAAAMNLDLQRSDRVLPVPFYFLDSNHAMNVKPKNYTWTQFYDLAVGVARHALSAAGIRRRFLANRGWATKTLNFVRAASSKKVGYQSAVALMLANDTSVRRYFEGQSTELPDFYLSKIRSGLGAFWDALPEGALSHDQNAYLRSQSATKGVAMRIPGAAVETTP